MKNIIKVVATGLVIGLASGSFAQTTKVPVDKLTPPLSAEAKNVVATENGVTAPAMSDVKNDRSNLEQLRNHHPEVAKLVSKNIDNAKEQGFTVKDLLNRIAAKVEMRNSSDQGEKSFSTTERHRTAVTRSAMRNRSFDQHNAAIRNRALGVR